MKNFHQSPFEEFSSDSKNLAELKANKISQKFNEEMVLGADSIIELNETIISKPSNRQEALKILEKSWKT